MDVIRLNNILIYARHGVHMGENELGGQFEIDLECFSNLKNAGKDDDLTQTVDYGAIYQRVVELFTQKPYKLIESVGEAICKSLLKQFPIEKVTIRIRKPHAPIDGILDTVEIELSRTVEDYA
ncbi:MAG: dihydroneopterin aldolase [Candidatus Marinimicrobia bacterium]|jgi:dihydroneopterin aldolase|nr:dihydroneopterin aldolase [Candidatus Neomarinimicrobiota bacterium]MBT3936135.1 dihydroneopterin aldolase [Candidatus Neomarinimicrobiota bacterium]MBT3961106.1 dihydroneopterin aldolase [Candidatus Neomarinimicrobiota bacterium]MBT4383032.1 dihydroneopterin aldolase [Candidatus Neomarinimicrobiota bacterium]MBT4636472.1 dihydroneopterin aldolase [Candidatus Neomarinimicrobiota bacterium]